MVLVEPGFSRPVKRRKTSSSSTDTTNSDTLSCDFIPIARSSQRLSGMIRPTLDLLARGLLDSGVVVRSVDDDGFNMTKVQLDVFMDKQWKTELCVADVDDEQMSLLHDTQVLHSNLRSKRDLQKIPLVHYSALLRLEGSQPFLDIQILWHNSSQSRGKLGSSFYDILAKHLPTESVLAHRQAESWEVREFYDNVYVPPVDEKENNLKIALLNCKLYPFQNRATQWLLSREGVQLGSSGLQPQGCQSLQSLPLDFYESFDANGNKCYVSHALGVVCSSQREVRNQYAPVKGGILAEAMGLGKTVEMIALVCAHPKRYSPLPPPQSDGLLDCGATLIITPPTILEQWKQEIREHAPALKVFHYHGLRAIRNNKSMSLEVMAGYDVVLTTYNVIAKEIHYVQEQPDRNLRDRPRAERPKSPLTQILWWRCLLDEAQMVESGVSHAAAVARRIPRVNSWAVTGTPLKQSHRDLYGLFLFLRQEPWSISPLLWDSLVLYHRPLLRNLINEMSLRHNQEMLKGELRLPRQSRQVITMPFTAIEESYYSQLFNDMRLDCAFDTSGSPVDQEWDPDAPHNVERMRTWLARLRQTCLHPEVGSHNRKALSRGEAPLRTVAQVLDVMIEQMESTLHTEQRNAHWPRLAQGQMLEHAGKADDALELYKATYDQISQLVDECRNELKKQSQTVSVAKGKEKENEKDDSEDENEAEPVQSSARQRLRSALEFQHMASFFMGNVYFQLKEKEARRQSDDASRLSQNPNDESGEAATTSRVAELEDLETAAYEKAKSIRIELLSEVRSKADRRIAKVRSKRAADGFVTLPEMRYFEEGPEGIESRKLFDKLYHFCNVMNTQADQIRAIRDQMADMLCRALVDEDEETELKGDEYELSTAHQDEMYVLMEILRALSADRSDAVTGLENLLIKQEMKRFRRTAAEGGGPAPALMVRLLAERDQKRIVAAERGSLRGILTEVRQLVDSLDWQAAKSNRAQAELVLANQLRRHVEKLADAQTKSTNALEQEVNTLILSTMNSRLDYYRGLQKISDTVRPYGDEETAGQPVDQRKFQALLDSEADAERKVSAAASKRRYLLHLKSESSGGGPKICTICQYEFENGSLTACGHHFCKECIQAWYAAKRSCPVCKRALRQADFYNITYKPSEVTVAAEPVVEFEESESSSPSDRPLGNSIYSGVSIDRLREIKSMDLRGESFGSKIDMICRHLHWMRLHDSGSKTIIFSQYRDFLNILGLALRQNGITHSKFDDKEGIQDFRTNPAIECFLLHAKAHSAGLNLVIASHVILCEPLINTAIELQAIARVHRIGQHRDTTVWMYLVADTVEESIYEISVKRRLAHIMHGSGSRSGMQTPQMNETDLDAANSRELQEADISKMLTTGKTGGELVDKEDLRPCLFGRLRDRYGLAMAPEGAALANGRIDRFLRAEAAMSRAG